MTDPILTHGQLIRSILPTMLPDGIEHEGAKRRMLEATVNVYHYAYARVYTRMGAAMKRMNASIATRLQIQGRVNMAMWNLNAWMLSGTYLPSQLNASVGGPNIAAYVVDVMSQSIYLNKVEDEDAARAGTLAFIGEVGYVEALQDMEAIAVQHLTQVVAHTTRKGHSYEDLEAIVEQLGEYLKEQSAALVKISAARCDGELKMAVVDGATVRYLDKGTMH